MAISSNILTPEFRRRANRYLSYLKFCKVKGTSCINIYNLYSDLSIPPSTIVDDFQKIGIAIAEYEINITQSIEWLESTLCINHLKEAFLILNKSTSSAITYKAKIKSLNIKIIAAFDPSINSEYEVDGIKVLPIQKLTNLANRMHIHVAIIACSPDFIEPSLNALQDAEMQTVVNLTSNDIKSISTLKVFDMNEFTQLVNTENNHKKA